MMPIRLHTRLLMLVLGTTCIVIGCNANLVAAQDTRATQPCWLENPMTKGKGGQIGIARSISATRQSPEEISRLRALTRLCASVGAQCDEDQLQSALSDKALMGRTLYFSSFKKKGYIYSYAGFDEPVSGLCAENMCSINQCSPAWLCTPSSGSQLGLVGVSYRSTSPERQYELASQNAFLQAEYLYGVNVKAEKTLQQALLNTGQYRNLSENSSLNSGERESIPYFIQNQCHSGGTLFVHMVLNAPESVLAQAGIGVENPDWLQSPKINGVDGAVGSVERMTASGLLSDQIKLAIRRAMVQLAFEKFSKVSEKSLSIQRISGGQLRISHINEQTDVNLKAHVLKIHFEQQANGVIKVYAWVRLMD